MFLEQNKHVTLKTIVMMLKIQLCHRRNKCNFKIYSNSCFKMSFSKYYSIFDQINAALVRQNEKKKKKKYTHKLHRYILYNTINNIMKTCTVINIII